MTRDHSRPCLSDSRAGGVVGTVEESGAVLHDGDGFPGQVVAGVGHEGQHQHGHPGQEKVGGKYFKTWQKIFAHT